MSETGVSITVKASGITEFQNRLRRANQRLEDLEIPTREAGQIALALAKSYPYGNWRAGQISFVDKYLALNM